MWLARRGSKSVYLFGQMPVLTGTDWLTPDIAAAFDGSDIVWLENPDNTQQSPEIMQAVDALNKRLAPPADFSVLSVLDDDYRNRLLQILKKEGLEPESLKGHRLTYTRQLLSFIRDRDSGADFKKIPEAIFRNRAKASGKPVFTEWRDFLEIVQWAADMPRVQKELVMMAIDEVDNNYQAALASWLSCKLDVQTRWMEKRSRLYPELYLQINTMRNNAMAGRIQDAMKKYEKQFVCMSISHMLGPDSIPGFLQKAGLDTSRI